MNKKRIMSWVNFFFHRSQFNDEKRRANWDSKTRKLIIRITKVIDKF